MSEIPNIPQDIIIDILYYLPAKSIARFKCASKSWFSILTHSKFIKNHLNKNIKNKKFLVVYPSCSLHALTFTPQNHFISRKLNFPPTLDKSWFKIIGSCGGLVLALNKRKEMFLINPTTSNYKKIPLNLDKRNLYMYGFGYDEYSDDFKIVSLSCCDYYETDDSHVLVDVYSLEENCWRRIQVFTFHHFSCPGASGVLLHGGIHWPATTGTDYSNVIASFDLSTEKSRGVGVPNDMDSVTFLFAKIVVLDCCLCMITKDNGSGINVWMMKEYGDQGSWIKLIRLYNDFNFLIPGRLVGDPVSHSETGEVEIFNVKEGNFMSSLIDGAPAIVGDGWAFVESLVSPNLNC